MSSLFDRLTDDQSMGFIAKLEDAFKNLPHLPKGLVEFLVKIAPWIAIILAILIVIFGPIGALLSVFTLLTLNPLLFIVTLVSVVLSLISGVLYFMAFNPLKALQLKGWVYLFWIQVLGVIGSLLNLLVGGFSVWTIIWILVWFYILFEMKPFYSNSPLAKVEEKV